MLQDRIAKRYATSIFDLAVEKNQLQSVANDFDTIGSIFKTNREFSLLLKSPIVTADKKRDILKAIFHGKISPITETFLGILVRKGRENVLEVVAREFVALFDKHQNQQKALITSAQQLSPETISLIKKQLENKFNSTILIETKINPDLIGGFVIRIDDLLYDTSILNRIQNLRKQFSENSYIVKL
ncbi:MAG: ATP synthase F1 subunit delta [Bacteroidia bacterium]|nr:ATP synthase F1 subunit delta [Bacteroidia bacterium]